jgi:transposase-like protein
MDPQDRSCHNPDCPARGQPGRGNIRSCHNPDCPARGQPGRGNDRVHGRTERRYRCTTCGRTFAGTRDTPFYHIKAPAELVTIVVTLLCQGCPLQAIVAAYGLDGRTVAAWRGRAGRHGQHCHGHHVLRGAGRVGARPGRRAVRQDGRRAGLDGDGNGGPVAALARRGDQPEEGPGPDHGAGPDGPARDP